MSLEATPFARHSSRMLRYAAVKSRRNRRPRIGVPWRTSVEEVHGRRQHSRNIFVQSRKRAATPVEISLGLSPAEVARLAETLDGFVLPGSPADIEPRRFGSAPASSRSASRQAAGAYRRRIARSCFRHRQAGFSDLLRRATAECASARHPGTGHPERGAARQEITMAAPAWTNRCIPFESKASASAELAGGSSASVNSSHHQAVRTVGRGLRVAARAPDGIIEAVEWTGGPGWVIGVQWHPERMPSDPFAQALFRQAGGRSSKRGANAKSHESSAGGEPRRRPKPRPKRKR